MRIVDALPERGSGSSGALEDDVIPLTGPATFFPQPSPAFPSLSHGQAASPNPAGLPLRVSGAVLWPGLTVAGHLWAGGLLGSGPEVSVIWPHSPDPVGYPHLKRISSPFPTEALSLPDPTPLPVLSRTDLLGRLVQR